MRLCVMNKTQIAMDPSDTPPAMSGNLSDAPRRSWLLPHRSASIDEERRVNALPWEPPPGMTKRQCERCGFYFSAIQSDQPLCIDCAIRVLQRPDNRYNAPFAERLDWMLRGQAKAA